MSKLHDVFHIDLLTPFRETKAYGQAHPQLPPVIVEGEEEYEVESIINDRYNRQKRKCQYLVKWKGYPHSENSWVDQKDLHAPELLAEYQTSKL